jgi:hypothetical protein
MADTTLAPFQPASMEEALSLSRQLAPSALLPKALQGKAGDVLIVLMTGRELGLAPMQALRSINVIDGKAVMAADLMVGLCLRQKFCEYFRLVESTAQFATYETKRAGNPAPTRLTWKIEQAAKANLLGKFNWKSYPEAMLQARCKSALARAVYPDVLAGVYDFEEMNEEPVAEEPGPPRVEAPAPKLARGTEEAAVEPPALIPLAHLEALELAILDGKLAELATLETAIAALWRPLQHNLVQGKERDRAQTVLAALREEERRRMAAATAREEKSKAEWKEKRAPKAVAARQAMEAQSSPAPRLAFNVTGTDADGPGAMVAKKGTLLSKLSDPQLHAAIDFAKEKLAKDPHAKWAPQMREAEVALHVEWAARCAPPQGKP